MKKEQEVELDKLKTYLEYAKKDNLDKFILDVKTAETVLSILKEKDKEIEKKDRIIDLMAEHIAFCKNINSYEDIKTYKRQIKQYFERKSE